MRLPNRKSSSAKVEVPKRVIRALRDYSSKEVTELSFKREDFFYVLSNPHDDDRWYDVTNPLSGKRGLVPASYFEVMESRQDRLNRIHRSASNASPTPSLTHDYSDSAMDVPPHPSFGSDVIHASLGIPRSVPGATAIHSRVSRSDSRDRPENGSSAPIEPVMMAGALRTRTSSIQQQYHQRQLSQHASSFDAVPMLPSIIEPRAVALYDFDAANSNELTLREGDIIMVVAQSTDDWIIAKPIQRGGPPGLVPASYVQMRDSASGAPITDLRAYLSRGNLRLRTATEWERKLQELRVSRSTASTASANSDVTTATAALIDRTGSPVSSHDGDHSPTPRSSVGSTLPAPGLALKKTRTRALTSSSSTSSIADRSSFRQPSKGRQPSGGSSQLQSSENFPPFHVDEVASVSVPTFICKDGAYLFQISLQFRSGDERNLYRGYDDFIYCRNQLHDLFPKETSPLKLARFSMHSSSMVYLNDVIAERRRSDIDEYVNGLLGMPEDVMNCAVVQRLFGSRVGSNLNRQSSAGRSLRRAGRPTQHLPSLSTDSTMESSFTPASASSSDTVVDDSHHFDVKGYSATYAAKSMDGGRRPSFAVPPMPAEPKMAEDFDADADADAAFSTRRLTHKASSATLSGKSSMVKVKIKLGSEMIALRLPSELTLRELRARIALKLGNEESAKAMSGTSQIMYHAPSGESTLLSDDQDWETALMVTNYKPILTLVQ
ncbi:bud emergence protein 1 [Coemansia sp. RSA 2675]|uniref:Bud emergence protein 1 n=1 Tax=Coemansia linderi TaxID=2663919 RepID=A0ACC1KHQ9_9FUNG|nr:bud emergence protein 1 [Coemansia sp. RSA 2675]KAJ2417297.1 bud emergence protein 1 [Coemansia sp. RSA 2530]KAJ2699375.1 bud emergence protein 1 [Coemansia sp. IMI 209128]KAJ2790130.1 bud emergence protein 1 [Coemansia linderi]